MCDFASQQVTKTFPLLECEHETTQRALWVQTQCKGRADITVTQKRCRVKMWFMLSHEGKLTFGCRSSCVLQSMSKTSDADHSPGCAAGAFALAQATELKPHMKA